MKKYFVSDFKCAELGYSMELRMSLAWELLKTNGVLMAKPWGEDSQGRQAIAVMPPNELAQRAVDIAEVFVALCEQRGYLVTPDMTVEQAMRELGRLERLKSRETWRKDDEKAA